MYFCWIVLILTLSLFCVQAEDVPDVYKFKDEIEQKRLEKYDANKDGKLDEAEWKKLQADRRKKTSSWDTNRNGVLEPKEREAMRDYLMRKYDVNRDGLIDGQEKSRIRSDIESGKAKEDSPEVKPPTSSSPLH